MSRDGRKGDDREAGPGGEEGEEDQAWGRLGEDSEGLGSDWLGVGIMTAVRAAWLGGPFLKFENFFIWKIVGFLFERDKLTYLEKS